MLQTLNQIGLQFTAQTVSCGTRETELMKSLLIKITANAEAVRIIIQAFL